MEFQQPPQTNIVLVQESQDDIALVQESWITNEKTRIKKMRSIIKTTEDAMYEGAITSEQLQLFMSEVKRFTTETEQLTTTIQLEEAKNFSNQSQQIFETFKKQIEKNKQKYTESATTQLKKIDNIQTLLAEDRQNIENLEKTNEILHKKVNFYMTGSVAVFIAALWIWWYTHQSK